MNEIERLAYDVRTAIRLLRRRRWRYCRALELAAPEVLPFLKTRVARPAQPRHKQRAGVI